jgi:hypothetical protein
VRQIRPHVGADHAACGPDHAPTATVRAGHRESHRRSWSRYDGIAPTCDQRQPWPRMWPMVTGGMISALRTISPNPPRPPRLARSGSCS